MCGKSRYEAVASGMRSGSTISHPTFERESRVVLTDGRKLGVILSDPLDGVQQHVQLLPRSHLDQQDVLDRRLGWFAPIVPLHLVIIILLVHG